MKKSISIFTAIAFAIAAVAGLSVLFMSTDIANAQSVIAAGMALPAGAHKLFDFKSRENASGIVKELTSDNSGMSLVEWLEIEHYKALGVDSPYAGRSYREIIKTRAKMNPDSPDFVPTAVELQLHANGIKIGEDSFRKFSSLNNGAGEYLMPAYLQLMFEVELFRDDLYSAIVGNQIGTSQLSYKKLKLVHSAEDVQLARVAIGAKLPEFKYETGTKSESMQKLGGKWRLPQEYLDAMVISAQDTQVRQILSYMQVEQTNEALRVIKAGDANGGAISGSSLVMNVGTTNTVSSTEVIKFFMFGQPQYFKNGYSIVGNADALAKFYAGWASLANYPGKVNDMRLNQPRSVIQWEDGIFASDGAVPDWIIKFSPDAVTEVYQNPGVRVQQMKDEDGNNVYTISKANVYVKGLDNSAVALNITL